MADPVQREPEDAPNGPTGLLIIRAWLEEGSAAPLRAHVRLTTDVSAGIEHTMTLTRSEAVNAAVEAWLSDIVNGRCPDSAPKNP